VRRAKQEELEGHYAERKESKKKILINYI